MYANKCSLDGKMTSSIFGEQQRLLKSVEQKVIGVLEKHMIIQEIKVNSRQIDLSLNITPASPSKA